MTGQEMVVTRRWLLGSAVVSLGCFGWLVTVGGTVLPARDPDGIPFWTAVAFTFLLLAGLSGLAARSGGWGTALRLALGLVGVASTAAGGLWLVTALSRQQGFEGYLVLLGLALMTQGLALAWAACRGSFPPPGASVESALLRKANSSAAPQLARVSDGLPGLGQDGLSSEVAAVSGPRHDALMVSGLDATRHGKIAKPL